LAKGNWITLRFAGEFCGGLHLPFGSFGQHRSNSTDAGRSESHPEKSGGLAGHFSSPVFMMLRGLFFAAPAETVAQMNMQQYATYVFCSGLQLAINKNCILSRIVAIWLFKTLFDFSRKRLKRTVVMPCFHQPDNSAQFRW